MGKYQIKDTGNGQFRWSLKAGNGETLIVSEAYTTKTACIKGIESSKKNVEDKCFARKESKRNEPFFNQIAGNYQVLGTSEMYSSASACEKGIESVKKNAPDAPIEDLTKK
jgi:uncharacterized protein YegP (UPF0339 family)